MNQDFKSQLYNLFIIEGLQTFSSKGMTQEKIWNFLTSGIV